MTASSVFTPLGKPVFRNLRASSAGEAVDRRVRDDFDLVRRLRARARRAAPGLKSEPKPTLSVWTNSYFERWPLAFAANALRAFADPQRQQLQHSTASTRGRGSEARRHRRDDTTAMASYYGLGIRTIADSPTVIKELEDQDDVGKLTLFGCGLRSLRGLPPLRHLTELVLAANELGPSLDALFPALSTCTLLTKLDLSQNALESLMTKNRLPSLEVLDCSSNKLRSLDGLATFAPRSARCKTRDNLEELEWQNDDDVDALVERALRTSVEVPRPAERRKLAARPATTCNSRRATAKIKGRRRGEGERHARRGVGGGPC